MRRFCSYGPIDTDLHYYVPREGLIRQALDQLRGERPDRGGHYITVWAPRQAGKTWVMQQVLWRLEEDDRFDVLKLNLEYLKQATDPNRVLHRIAQEIIETLQLPSVRVTCADEFYDVFRRGVLRKPLILIMDEFDALSQEAINGVVGVFRNIYIKRRDQGNRPTAERDYLLHGVALVGVRAVLGVESVTGSPFNVQRSVRIPNLTAEEVNLMYRWYEEESGQRVEQEVIERVYYETRGQPGLVSWLGELLTETYNPGIEESLDGKVFRRAYSAAINLLPNANILNIISKARHEDYRGVVLDLFRTAEKVGFSFDDPKLNYLYLNGVIDWEEEEGKQYVRFSSPFVQKRLFNYFSREIFPHVGRAYEPFEDLSAIITEEGLNVPNLLRRYERYLRENRGWLLRNVPRRRTDMRPYEAVFHFSLYTYLFRFLEHREASVWPEFPTGNGKIDILIEYLGERYGIEVKSYVDAYEYRRAIGQAARYGRSLGLDEITLAFFVEGIDEANRARYEVPHHDEETGVVVHPVFIETGE